MSILEVFANNHIDPPWASVVVAMVDFAYLGAAAFCAQQLVRARAAEREAKSAHDPNEPLREQGRFVAGTCERARGHEIALRVTIQQEGTEQRGKHPSHSWREVSRNVEAMPFYVRHASGARVRVEPGRSEVLLVDKLDQTEWTQTYHRRLRAELTEGEPVVVEGVLSRGQDPEHDQGGASYRDAGAGWVLEPRGGKLHCSTEDLSRRHHLRARAFAGMLLWLPIFWALGQIPLVSFRARQLLGENVRADYQGRRHWTTRGSKGGTQHHYAVSYEYTDESGRDYSGRDEIDDSDYRRMPDTESSDLGLGGESPLAVGSSRGPNTELWVRIVPGHPSMSSPGRGASVNVALLGLSMAMAAWAFWMVQRRHMHRRWYEGPKHDSGGGVLPSPSGQTFATPRPKAR